LRAPAVFVALQQIMHRTAAVAHRDALSVCPDAKPRVRSSSTPIMTET
jgi:hypothetical protein